MYLYERGNKSIKVYSFVPNKEELIKLKKKYLEDIKSVIVHINNEETHESMFENSEIMFSDLDRKEDNDKVTYIEETKNDKDISRYINGEYDPKNPLNIIGDYVSRSKSNYSGELYNEEGTLLFDDIHHFNNEFITSGGILLTGCLSYFQPLLSDNINNVLYPCDYKNLDGETIDFFKIFKCEKERTIKIEDLEFMQENGLIQFGDTYQDSLDKSKIIIKSYKKVRKMVKNK